MTEFSKLVEDYSRHPVPEDKTVTGFHIAIMVIGVMITVPAFVLGAQLGASLGFSRAFTGIVLGAVLLSLIASLTGMVGVKTHLSTSMINRYTFGKSGAVIINTILGITALGWFSVIIALFGEAAMGGLNEMGLDWDFPRGGMVFGSLLTTLIAIFGFKALDKMSLIVVPIMMLFLILVLYLSIKDGSLTAILSYEGSEQAFDLGATVSLIVGSYIVGTTIFPDMCRYVKSAPHVWIGSFLAFSVGYIIVLSLVMIPSIKTGEPDLIKIISLMGLGVFGFAMLLFSTVTTVAFNLYTGSLAAAALFQKVDKWKLVVILGIVSTIAATLGADQYFINWIIILSLAIPPIGGVYVVDWLVLKRHDVNSEPPSGFAWPALISCLAGSGVAYSTQIGMLQLTAVSAMDAMLTAMLVYFLIMKFASKP